MSFQEQAVDIMRGVRGEREKGANESVFRTCKRASYLRICHGVSAGEHGVVDEASLHLLAWAIWRVWRVCAIDLPVPLCLVHLLYTAGILGLHLPTSWRIPNGRKMRSGTGSIVLAGCALSRIIGLTIDRLASLTAALAFILTLPLRFFFLLALLPLLADLFEFYMFMLVSGANLCTSVHQRNKHASVGLSI